MDDQGEGRGVGLERVEVGIVSSDRAVVDFLAAVFELDELPAIEFSAGRLHRLQSPGTILKVMVPSEVPADGDGRPFMAVKGFRYVTVYVADLDRVLERCVARGGRVVLDPVEHELGARLAIIADPDGNTMEVVGPLPGSP